MPEHRPIGAHAPASGGLATRGLSYAAAVGAEAIQVFVTNPRAWSPAAGNDDETRTLRERTARTGMPVFVHAPYLINIASPDTDVRERSQVLLGYCLDRGREIAARGLVLHTGSATDTDRASGLRRVREVLLPVLDALRADGPDLLLEPMAGQGHMLCATIGEFEPYLAALDGHPRAMLCLDTCHVFAAGHDLTGNGGVRELLAEVNRIAAGRLRLIHANDSADGCGSRRDRHRNIGQGLIGRRPFWDLLHDPGTAGVPFVVETPGAEDGQRADIARLKRLRASARPPAAPARISRIQGQAAVG